MPFPFLRKAADTIRERLDTGFLPTDAPQKMYAGYGHYEICAGCDDPILPSQIAYEMAYGDDRSFTFHLGCAGLWEAECRRRGHRHG